MISFDENDRGGNRFFNNGVFKYIAYAKNWKIITMFHHIHTIVWFAGVKNQIFSLITQDWNQSELQQSFEF